MRINLDLHIHSRFSAATSERMDLPMIAVEAAKKGVELVGTGDCFHPRWQEEIGRLAEEDGVFRLSEGRLFRSSFVLSGEVEDCNKVHHLILVPDMAKAQELSAIFAAHSANLHSEGRPALQMEGPAIADAAREAGCLIGPSHAFTPWTGVFAHHRTLREAYGGGASSIDFLELGLSADSDYADRISELHPLTFLTNSDAHSPWSNKLGREFNQMEMEEISFPELAMAIRRHRGRRPTLNVGFYPEEGKYNRTACTRCYQQYSRQEMEDRLGRCRCGGLIKMGVRDRVDMLADLPQVVHPAHRPPYLHLIPLVEIVAMALGHKNVNTAGVARVCSQMIGSNTEIEVLLKSDLSSLNAEPRVLQALRAFRQGTVIVRPGGGGRYGQVSLPDTAEGRIDELDTGSKPIPCGVEEPTNRSRLQRSLLDY
ncbi:MAG: hypothetical protein A4E45_01658 [Methanosaeta sp. PtaB.Bin039]|nr:MAG: hypothetical protein A4E45_01658 [Methanosaeta sp. PtaB.Bin039]